MERVDPYPQPYLLRVLLCGLCCEGDYTKNLLIFRNLEDRERKACPIWAGLFVIGRIGVCQSHIWSKGSHEFHQILFLLRAESQFKNQIEKLHRILQRKKPSIMEIRRRILNASQWKSLSRTICACHTAVDHARFIETLRLQVMHEIVGVVGCWMTAGASGLTEENSLPPLLRFGRFSRIDWPSIPALELVENPESLGTRL